MERFKFKHTRHEFIKVGKFLLSENPVKFQFDDDLVWDLNLELSLFHDEFRSVGESVYAITVDDTPVYVGLYAATLGMELLTFGDHLHHDQELRITWALEKGERVELCLARDVFAELEGRMINISSSIQRDIIENEALPWSPKEPSPELEGVKTMAEIERLLA
jgi:hypothetical protein